jgi:hypothetical protein
MRGLGGLRFQFDHEIDALSSCMGQNIIIIQRITIFDGSMPSPTRLGNRRNESTRIGKQIEY